jgi:hypothetical protein
MPRQTINALLTQANVTLADNVTGDISAADVRDLLKDVIDTFKPGFGAVSNPSVTLPSLFTTPVVIPYTTLLAVTVDFTATPAAGTVKRNALGLPTVNNRISFFADVLAPAGSDITLALYRDGIQVPGGVTVAGRGASTPTAAGFEILNGTPVAGDPIYEVRAAKISGAASAVGFNNVRFILEVIPTIGA